MSGNIVEFQRQGNLLSFPFSAFGLILAATFCVIAFVALWPIFGALKRHRYLKHFRWILAVIILLLPIGDELWIEWRFESLCENAGVYVSKRVHAEGFYDETAMRSQEEYLARNGFRFMENRGLGRAVGVVRVEQLNGVRTVHQLARPTARYHYKRVQNNERVGYRLFKTEYVVVDSGNAEVIARRTIYKRYPGWIEGLWVHFFGTGMKQCPDPARGPRQPEFPESVFDTSASQN